MTTEELLKTAIRFEERSFDFYQRLKETVRDSMSRNTLDYLSQEELKHKDFLEQYLRGNITGSTLRLTDPHDSKIVEAFKIPSINPDLELKDAFLVAAEREKESHEFYSKLADLHPDGRVKDLLKQLAQEELAHKEKVEYLYVNAAFPQTAGG
jgi:rubrerythrin